ncbi:MAG: DUF1353 domain-containing protein [Alphaproteobacteria bacterium]|nr:DUF1353 domain-containing protein [Alphaproteobacteria bacterium]
MVDASQRDDLTTAFTTSKSTLQLLCDGDLTPTGTFREGRPEFRLTRPLVFEDIVVPKFYVTDRYSLPGRLIPLLWEPHHARYSTPAVIHDWLFETKLKPFEDSNAILMRAMQAAGVRADQRWIVFLAVSFFGRRGYGVVDPDNIPLVRSVRPDLRGVLA